MPRYFRMTEAGEGVFQITGEEVHHLLRVMRKKPGDRISLCDGQGRFFAGEITEISSESVIGRLLEEVVSQVEPSTKVILCQAMSKGDKMDEVIRKGTEIGVAEFIPFISKRCVSRPDEGGAGKRLQRWERIAEEAAKQAGRAVVPLVRPVAEWPTILELAKHARMIVAWEGERSQGLKGALADLASGETIALVVGSEGGFGPDEMERVVQAGAQTVSLGPRILRTETAGPVLAALTLFALDEMEPIAERGERE